jgi:hypothetical protein
VILQENEVESKCRVRSCVCVSGMITQPCILINYDSQFNNFSSQIIRLSTTIKSLTLLYSIRLKVSYDSGIDSRREHS